MSETKRPLNGDDSNIVDTGNGPTEPREVLILEAEFGKPNEFGVYAPHVFAPGESA